MMNAVEIMDAQDLVADLASISDLVRIELYQDEIADELDKAVKRVTNLVERLRLQS
jgi:flagellar biosynthesis/type III secretory pathway ATPase